MRSSMERCDCLWFGLYVVPACVQRSEMLLNTPVGIIHVVPTSGPAGLARMVEMLHLG